MKLLKTDQDRFVFQISTNEKGLLFGLLKHHPLVSPAHQQLSKTMDLEKLKDDQKLLEESLAEAKRDNQKQLVAMLTEAGRFQAGKGGYRFALTAGEVDWMLQVLNDIRVGSWIKLGSPDQDTSRRAEWTEETAPYWLAMELCGAFQMVLLEALDGGLS